MDDAGTPERRRSAGDVRPYHATTPVSSAWAPRSSSLPPLAPHTKLHALRLNDTTTPVHGHRDVVECASWSLTSPPRTTLSSLPRGWAATEEEEEQGQRMVIRRRATAEDEDEKQTPSIRKKVSRLVSPDGARPCVQRLRGAKYGARVFFVHAFGCYYGRGG